MLRSVSCLSLQTSRVLCANILTMCGTPRPRFVRRRSIAVDRVRRRSPARLRALRGLIRNSTEDFKRAVYPHALRRRLNGDGLGEGCTQWSLTVPFSPFALGRLPASCYVLTLPQPSRVFQPARGVRRFFFVQRHDGDNPCKRILIDDWDLDLDDPYWRQSYLVPRRSKTPKLVHKILFSMLPGTPPTNSWRRSATVQWVYQPKGWGIVFTSNRRSLTLASTKSRAGEL